MDKKQQIKIVIYSLLVILLGVASYYYYNYLQKQAQDLEVSTQNTVSKQLADRKLSADILRDRKFKELQRIKVEESYLSSGKTAPTGTSEVLEEVSKIPRRHSNPFQPF